MNSEISKIEILPEHNLLRRYVYPNPPKITLIKDDGTICSTCFHLRPGEEGISVDIEHLTTYEKAIVDTTKHRLLRLNAGDVQALDLTTEHDPIAIDTEQEPVNGSTHQLQYDNYAHALIKGKIDKKIPKKLAALAIKINYPE